MSQLPFLPGYRRPDPTKTDFKKSHAFGFRNDVPVFNGEAPGIGGDPLRGQTIRDNRSRALAQRVEGVENVPSFIAFDRKVLRFFGFFQEGVHESRLENYRIRRVKLYYYLEDDSIQINEEKQDNAGIPQGCLVKRHRLPKGESEEEFVTFEDLDLRLRLPVYGRVIYLTDCDDFTKRFYARAGLQLSEPDTLPHDPFLEHQAKTRPAPRISKPVDPEKLAFRQFLSHDREVLRFYCVWDDRSASFGDVRKFVLHYFLADDTIEIREMHSPNSGYDAASLFVRRQRMPKVFTGMTDHRVRNFYTDADLMIGRTIRAFNRDFLMYDADAFTKDFYTRTHGVDSALLEPVSISEPRPTPPVREVPPHLGFGSEEDSLTSCLHLYPKAPRKDWPKMLENEGRAFRFTARLAECPPTDAERRFIVSAFLSDDTLSVFEPPARNSGFVAGKFLERRKFKKPDDPAVYMTPFDLQVGQVVDLFGHKLLLMDADDHTLHEVLAVPGRAPVSPDAELRRLQEAMIEAQISAPEVVAQCDAAEADGGRIKLAFVRRALIEWGVHLDEAMCLSLVVRLDPGKTTLVDPTELIAALSPDVPTA
eukprot:gnl/Trimastix_PCT/944.p1 GENE.gnl/Trimastix_PCT/944~~gnl/Trimastix_PCT/944.p1  ORF type:complete len:592 (-),score=180.26 gnl/Trimastix_PCT/944:85-1860(-)